MNAGNSNVDRTWGLVLWLVTITLLCFWGTNLLQLFDWDELNFAEVSREMRLSGTPHRPTVNYLPFNEKPPLFFYLQTLSFDWFGVTPRGARFPNLLAGLATFLALWWLSRRPGVGLPPLAWPLFMGLSLLPALYFQSGIIDPWFNLFILLGLWHSLRGEPLTTLQVLGSGLLLGLAVLTKGPAAGLIAGLCWVVLLVTEPEHRGRRAAQYAMIGALALVPGAVWISSIWNVDDGAFATEFLSYQWRLFVREDAGHGGFPGFHAVALLFGCFPASWLALPYLFRFRRGVDPDRTERGMRILFWVVLLLFTVVNTKIIHYSSLCYLPLTYLAGKAVYEHIPARWVIWARHGLLLNWCLYAIAALSLPLLALTIDRWLPLFNDAELVSRLNLPVVWPWYTFVPALVAGCGVAWQVYQNRQAAGEIVTADAQIATVNAQIPTSDVQIPIPDVQITTPNAQIPTVNNGWKAGTPIKLRWVHGHLILSGLFLLTSLFTLAPRVQQYSQGAPVAFFKSLSGKDVYVGTAYYKSYAHWFYAAVPPERYAGGCKERECRFHGVTTKPLYFASPLSRTEQVLREVPDAELLNQSGGYSFYRRPPASTQ